jgi:hypothetical protein
MTLGRGMASFQIIVRISSGKNGKYSKYSKSPKSKKLLVWLLDWQSFKSHLSSTAIGAGIPGEALLAASVIPSVEENIFVALILESKCQPHCLRYLKVIDSVIRTQDIRACKSTDLIAYGREELHTMSADLGKSLLFFAKNCAKHANALAMEMKLTLQEALVD